MTLLYAISEMFNALPVMALYVVCVWDVPGVSRRPLVVACTCLAALLVVCGTVCWTLSWSSLALLAPSTALIAVVLRGFTRQSLTRPKFLFAGLTFAFVGACVTWAAVVVDALAVGDTLSDTYLAWPGMITQWVLWCAIAAALFKPLRVHGPAFLADAPFDDGIWRLAWLLPALLCATLVFTNPSDTASLLTGDAWKIAVATIVLLGCLSVVIYALMVRLVEQTQHTLRATEEARRFELIALQANRLEERMSQARQARHDLRQHYCAIQGFLASNDIEGLRAYTTEFFCANGSLDNTPLIYCANVSANAIASFYLEQARQLETRIDVDLRLPERLGQTDADVAIVLGNLLQNAVDALTAQEHNPRTLSVHAVGGEKDPLVITVDNSYEMPVVQLANGSLASTKHEGMGVGTASVAAVARRLHGFARFDHNGSMFEASVMLGAGPHDQHGQAR